MNCMAWLSEPCTHLAGLDAQACCSEPNICLCPLFVQDVSAAGECMHCCSQRQVPWARHCMNIVPGLRAMPCTRWFVGPSLFFSRTARLRARHTALAAIDGAVQTPAVHGHPHCRRADVLCPAQGHLLCL